MRSSITTITFGFVLTAGLLSSAACDSGEDPVSSERSAELAKSERQTKFKPAPLSEAASTPAPAVEAPTIAAPPSTLPKPLISSAPQQWQAWVDAELVRVQTEAPRWFAQVMSAEPKRTRSGFLRLVGPALEDPNAAPVLLHRYLSADERPEVQAAVIAALLRTRSDAYTKVIGELLTTEPNALVRIGMLTSLTRKPGADALAALELGLGDADPQVRLTAINLIASHPDGASLAAPMIAALDDVPKVQLAAARSLGYLHADAATDALTGLLTSTHAAVRLASLQAIDRIDPEHAEGLTQLSVLVDDDDPKVARAAAKIAKR